MFTLPRPRSFVVGVSALSAMSRDWLNSLSVIPVGQVTTHPYLNWSTPYYVQKGIELPDAQCLHLPEVPACSQHSGSANYRSTLGAVCVWRSCAAATMGNCEVYRKYFQRLAQRWCIVCALACTLLIGYKHQQPKVSNRHTQQNNHDLCLLGLLSQGRDLFQPLKYL